MKKCFMTFVVFFLVQPYIYTQTPQNLTIGIVSSQENGQGVISVNINQTSITCQLSASQLDLQTPYDQNIISIDQTTFNAIYDSYIGNGIHTLGDISTANVTEGPSLIISAQSENGIEFASLSGGKMPISISSFLSFVNTHLADKWKISFEELLIETLPEQTICEEVPRALKNKNNGSHYHAATSVGYKISLQEAARNGMINLESKGCHTGDCIRIKFTADRTYNQDDISAVVFINFGGTASQADLKNFKKVVESTWSDLRATNGKVLNSEVIYRKDLTTTNVPGYHRVVFNDELADRNFITYDTGTDISTIINSTNQRSSGGFLTTSIEGALGNIRQTWSHEFGHLLGQRDYYIQALHDCLGDKNEFLITYPPSLRRTRMTEAEMALKIKDFGTQNVLPADQPSAVEILSSLQASCPKGGAKGYSFLCSDGIMSDPRKGVEQNIVDNLTSIGSEYIILNINAGDVLVPQNDSLKNFIVTRSDYILLKKGESITLDGMWGADFHRNSFIATPEEGEVLDVATNIFDWGINTPSVNQVQEIIEQVNEEELYCNDYSHQLALWSIAEQEDFPEIIGNGNSKGTEFIEPMALRTNMAEKIPSLSEWGIIILSLLLVTFSVLEIRQRNYSQNSLLKKRQAI